MNISGTKNKTKWEMSSVSHSYNHKTEGQAAGEWVLYICGR